MAKAKQETKDITGPALPPTETYTEADSIEQNQDANIIFIGQRMLNGELVDATPFPEIHSIDTVYNLPDAKTQLAGFYHKDAKAIIKEWPQYYKAFKKKGAK